MKKSLLVILVASIVLLTLAAQCFRAESAESFDPDRDEALTAWFPFDGDLADKTGKFGSGKVIGDKIEKETADGTVEFVEGVSGQAVYLDGTKGIQLPDDLIKDYDYTVSFWMKWEGDITPFTPVFFGAYDPNSWISIPPYHSAVAGGSFLLWSFSDYWYDGILNVSFKPGTWYHVAAVVNNGRARVYVKGKYVLSKIQINGVEDMTGKVPDVFRKKPGGIFTVGVNWWDPTFKGVVDDLRIYDRPLSKSEIEVLYGKR